MDRKKLFLLLILTLFLEAVFIAETSSAYTLDTVAGGYRGDGLPGTPGILWNPQWLALDGAGNVLFSESLGHRLRSVDPRTGEITDFAGNGETGWSGDGGPALQGSFYYPGGVARDSAGNTFIADTWNHVIRMVDPSGVITTIAGTGEMAGGIDGEGGDPSGGSGGPA